MIVDGAPNRSELSVQEVSGIGTFIEPASILYISNSYLILIFPLKTKPSR